MSNNIEEKSVVITSANSGLGEAIAGRFSAQGASVVLGQDISIVFSPWPTS